ncbi:conserved hypothetical protein [Ricinus communis]|uniref:Uncharacterized protein n=1 Tax=Ricinus communis TaxID=3988 RepID=B9T9W7_RICCO|nr:conserved hypothetical protein [Ricinus communis]
MNSCNLRQSSHQRSCAFPCAERRCTERNAGIARSRRAAAPTADTACTDAAVAGRAFQ